MNSRLMWYTDTVTSDAPQAPPPQPPEVALQFDCAVGLQPIAGGATGVSFGYSLAGVVMGSLVMPLEAADEVANQLKAAVHKGRNPLISGPEVAHLIGRIPRNEH